MRYRSPHIASYAEPPAATVRAFFVPLPAAPDAAQLTAAQRRAAPLVEAARRIDSADAFSRLVAAEGAEELRGVEVYNAVLLALAAGRSTVKTIAGASGVPERNLHYLLQQFVELGYVARRIR